MRRMRARGDGREAEHDLALSECIKKNGKRGWIGQQASRDAQANQHQKAGPLSRRQFEIVGVFEAPAVAVGAAFFMSGVMLMRVSVVVAMRMPVRGMMQVVMVRVWCN